MAHHRLRQGFHACILSTLHHGDILPAIFLIPTFTDFISRQPQRQLLSLLCLLCNIGLASSNSFRKIYSSEFSCLLVCSTFMPERSGFPGRCIHTFITSIKLHTATTGTLFIAFL